MISAQDKKVRELSRAVQQLSRGIERKKAQNKPKSLDFLNNLTGLNIPKKKRTFVFSKPTPKTETKIVEKKVWLGPPGEKGEKGDAGERGRNGRDGRAGKDGITPVKGVDYLTPQEIESLKKEILSEVKFPEGFQLTEEVVKDIVRMMHKLPEADKLEVSQGIRNASSFIYGGTKYKTSELMHGGGSSSSGGSTLTAETPVGTIDDSNTTFTVTHQPLYIIVNGAQYTVGTGLYSSYVSGTITLSSPVGVGGFIVSFFNA